jgi:hypothetical protein
MARPLRIQYPDAFYSVILGSAEFVAEIKEQLLRRCVQMKRRRGRSNCIYVIVQRAEIKRNWKPIWHGAVRCHPGEPQDRLENVFRDGDVH